MTTFPKSRTKDLVVQELEKELLIYDLSNNKAFCLNETSALVFQFCNGNNSVAEITELMSNRLKILISEDFVWLALDGLQKDGLLEHTAEFEIDFNGQNRRQIIKKIGLASMIALPLVSSVVAPPAVNAQSVACFAPGAAGCTFFGGTQSNCCDSNQRCLSACTPCINGVATSCSTGPGCCAGVFVPTAICCNPGPFIESTNPSFPGILCNCP